VELGRLKTILAKHTSEIFSNQERDLLELPKLVKKAMENKCWKERGMKHTHLDRWTCASGKWMIMRHE
jgi:hypothetical protein